MNPDLQFRALPRNHALIVEAKGGESLKRRQLDAAAALTPEDLARGMTFERPDEAQFTYLIACFESGAREIIARLDDGGFDFPVLCFFDDKIKLVRGKINDAPLHEALFEGVSLPVPVNPPSGYVPFDNNSSLAEIASAVLAYIVAELVRDKPHFQVQELLGRIVPIWDRLHPHEKHQLVNAVLKLLRAMIKFRGAGARFGAVLKPAGSASAPNLYEITNKVSTSGGGERAFRFETLLGWANAYVASIGGDPLPSVEPPGEEGTQGSFWSRSG